MTRLKNSIAGIDAALASVDIGGEEIALWRVADLERHVDRAVLLTGENPAEPPYWAHLWGGALVLASSVPHKTGAVLELGCGLGLPGMVAARRGARVTFVDRVPAALAFVRASARANHIDTADFVAADFTTPFVNTRFDVVLASEILYDRAAFPAVADAITRLAAPSGTALLTDAHRTDTRAFYAELGKRRLDWTITAHTVREERLPVTVDLVEIRI